MFRRLSLVSRFASKNGKNNEVVGKRMLLLGIRQCSSSAGSLVISEKIGSVQMIGINRPEKRNAIDPATAVQLFNAVKDFESDEETTAAVLYGKGGMFSSGFDLRTLAHVSKAEEYLSHCNDSGQGPIGPTRYFCSKPVIAAVEGYAVAGGMELALWCDLRVMEENAIMGVFCRRFGVPFVDGGTSRLPKLIGLSRALDLILTGREIRAKEALEIGLVNRICDTGSAVGRALTLAQEISKFPQECMRADRQSAYNATFSSASHTQALEDEFQRGLKIIEKESIKGAGRFVSGIGRHGSFNLHRVQDSHPKEE